MGYERRCHVCGDTIPGQVAYTRVVTKKKETSRQYACPTCFFERLKERDRASYEREMSLGGLTRVDA